MQSAFGIVVVVVGVVGVLGAVACLLAYRRTWESLGSDRLLLESDLHDRATGGPPAGHGHGHGHGHGPAESAGPAPRLQRETEIRQMLQAGNVRRRRRGQPELDVDAELARLTRLT